MPSKPRGELVCPVCGKIFYCNYVDTWVYTKIWFGKQYVCCTWTCYRKIEKVMEERKMKGGRKRKGNDKTA